MIAHSLPDPFFGPAQNLHGATYVADVEFMCQTLNKQQVVIDIGRAKLVVQQVLQTLNYQNLDELPQFQNQLTTTEFLAKYLHDQIKAACGAEFSGRIKVTLGETHDAWGSYQGDE